MKKRIRFFNHRPICNELLDEHKGKIFPPVIPITFRDYLPKIVRFWDNKIWHFIIFRYYGMELDFRKEKVFNTIMERSTKRKRRKRVKR